MLHNYTTNILCGHLSSCRLRLQRRRRQIQNPVQRECHHQHRHHHQNQNLHRQHHQQQQNHFHSSNCRCPIQKSFIVFILISCHLRYSMIGVGADGSEHLKQQRFAMEPQNQTAVLGSRVTLPCRVIDKMGALQWTKDDFGLGQHRNLSGFERYSMVGSDEEGDYSLDIYPVMLDDDARYQCQVGPGPNGEPGIRSTFATLTVLVPPEAPKITQGEFLKTTEDRDIELECLSVGGKPAAEITWIDGSGNVITKGIEYVKEPYDQESRRFTAKSILKFTPKRKYHNTEITCQAQNTADRTYRSAKLTLEVKYAPKVEVKVVGDSLVDGRIPEGAEVRLSCITDAYPKEVEYKWYINDEEVVGDYNTFMVIHNVTRSYHNSVVKCEVTNAVGKSTDSETLDISFGPKFILRPESVEARIGDTVHLACLVSGNPQPEVVWLNENADTIIKSDGNLTFQVTPETAGNYVCKATVNGFTSIETQAKVYIKRPPIITSKKTYVGKIGDDVEIECIAYSIPMATQVLWSYNGFQINGSSPMYSIFNDNLSEGIKSVLLVTGSSSNQYGRYNCTVYNEFGSDSIEILLISQKIIPIIAITIGAVVTVVIILIPILYISINCKREIAKLPPADIIHDVENNSNLNHHHHRHNNKKCEKEIIDQNSINEYQTDTGQDTGDYIETTSTTGSTAFKLNSASEKHSPSLTESSKGGGGKNSYFVPLAGPVYIPSDLRISDDYKTYSKYGSDYHIQESVLTPMKPASTQMLENTNPFLQHNNDNDSQSILQNGLPTTPNVESSSASQYMGSHDRLVNKKRKSSHLPPLPPPSTANPAITPAPPPYNSHRSPYQQLPQPIYNKQIQHQQQHHISSNSSNNDLSFVSNGLLHHPQHGKNPSGQFILSSNENLQIKPAAAATHV